LLRRCLEKDRRKRLADAADARLEIEDALAAPTAEAAAVTPRRVGLVAIASLLGVVAIAAATLAAALYVERTPVGVRTLRYSMSPPAGWQLSLAARPGAPTPIVLAPDGRSLALVVRRGESADTIWIQPLDALTPHPLAGTEGASSVFWSPDSRQLGFFADGKLKKIDAAGGPPTTLCEAPGSAGGTWSRDGVIVINGGVSSLKKVSASGGMPTEATMLGPGEQAHFRPWLLPDGRHVLYTVLGSGPQLALPIYLGSLDSGDRVKVGESSSTNVMYAQGHLLFMQGTTLMAQPLDGRRFVPSGEAFPVADNVQSQGAEPHQGVFSVSDNGVLMYQTGRGQGLSQLTWIDRHGKPLATVGDAAPYWELALSPDDKHVVVSLGVRDLWTIDLARGLRTRFTFDQNTNMSPIWSSNGERIVYGRVVAGRPQPLLYQKLSNGAGPEEALFADNRARVPTDWSADGRFLLFVMFATGTGNADIWVWPRADDQKPAPLLTTPFNESAAKFSPDGRWVAYVSDESGRNEVYVVPFATTNGPAGATAGLARGKWQISTGGGTQPRWRRDGQEIFYFEEGQSRLMAAGVNGQSAALEVGAAQPLFTIRSVGGATGFGPYRPSFYDVSRDGQRLLVNAPVSEGQGVLPSATVVINWLSASRK
jgi:Tol biopolymer transport system component